MPMFISISIQRIHRNGKDKGYSLAAIRHKPRQRFFTTEDTEDREKSDQEALPRRFAVKDLENPITILFTIPHSREA